MTGLADMFSGITTSRKSSDSSAQNLPTPEEQRSLLTSAPDTGRTIDNDDPDLVPPATAGKDTADVEANDSAAGDPSCGEATGTPRLNTSSLVQVVGVLAIGLFASNLDGFLVLAIHPRIASEFNALEDSSWIFVSFLLAGAATQVLYAKLSDVYGRRVVLVFCYALFGLGCAVIGFSRSLWHVVLGRVLSGSGGSGMASLVLVLTTDLVPLRDVASWLGYINIVSTTGRSIGGPLGGFLADSVGWRWSFLGQTPFFAVAILAAILVIPNTKAPTPEGREETSLASRLDLVGSLLLGLAVLLIMLPLEVGGQKIPWDHPAIACLFVAGLLTLSLFIANEARWAREPAMPLWLLQDRDIAVSYFVICCIAAAQTAVTYLVPLYFQVTAGVSSTIAGLHLVPSVLGNTIGGLVAGYLIKSTGGYKTVALGSSVCASVGFLLLIARWSGNTRWWESFYIFPCGFASGMGWPAITISLNAVTKPQHRAVISSVLQLVTPIAMLLGVASSSAVMLAVLQRNLGTRLTAIGIEHALREEFIGHAIASVEYIRELPAQIAEAVVASYVLALKASFGLILFMSLTGLIAGMFLRQRTL